MSESPKRFEDWYEVDCNKCQRYYDSSCDGVQKGSKKACNSYLATREVVIPEMLNRLEKRVSLLECAIGLSLIICGILILVVYFG